MNWRKTLIICTLILVSGGAATYYIFNTEPQAVREGATREMAMLIEVLPAEKGRFQPTIVATGTVEPSIDIILSPRVSGEIINSSGGFVPGGFVREGEVLLQVDPADYENTLKLRQTDLALANAELALEMGRQTVAQKDFQLLNDTLTSENRALVLRQPQLQSAQSRRDAARAEVQQAELELERTKIKAPFDAQIIHREANLGSMVSAGDNLARLVGLDSYWVVASIPLSKLRWLVFPDSKKGRGSEVIIRNRTAWQDGEYRIGHLYKLIGALEDQTRLARVIVSVRDPLLYKSGNKNLPPLMIGSFVEATILAREISDIIRVPRDYIRKDETIWIMVENRLQIRSVNIEFQDADYAYISDGLEENELIVTTNLTTVVDGVALRLEDVTAVSGEDSLLTSENSDGMESSSTTNPQ